MGLFSDLIEQDGLIIPLLILNAILGILVIINIIYTIIMKKKYLDFMKRMGNGKDLDEMLRKYLEDVREIKRDNAEIKAYYTKLDNDIDTCIQKIGLVRYNAFKDVGSDLSFAIAMLDRNDNGVILNGLYGSESSNIYAKPVKGGISKYQLSDEEKTALEIAEQSKNFIAKHRK